MVGSERPARKAIRYAVQAPVSFRWKDEKGNEQRGEGTSRDVSETGAFVLTVVSPPLGADIGITIFFDAVLRIPTAIPMNLDGQVLRVEQIVPSSGIGGFAFLTKKLIFAENEESADKGNPGGIGTNY